MYKVLVILTTALISAASSSVLAQAQATKKVAFEKEQPTQVAIRQVDKLPAPKKVEAVQVPSSPSQRSAFFALLVSLWHGGK